MADIRIKGRMVNALRISLDTNDHDAIRQQLKPKLQAAFPPGTLAVIESSVDQELIALIQLLIDLEVQPMAVTEGILGIRLVRFSSLFCHLTVSCRKLRRPKNRSWKSNLNLLLMMKKLMLHRSSRM